MHATESEHKSSKLELKISSVLSKKDYKIIKKIGEGTFSEVMKVQNLKDGKQYACKSMKQSINSLEQAYNLREVQAMKRLSLHPNILQLHELVYDQETKSLCLICELMEMNIYELIRGRQQSLPESKVKHYMYQLCKALDHMHSNGIFHRDVKPENILIKNDVLKLADFGSCRSVYSKPPHTEYISTRWYRAPECLLTDGYYSLKMDMWSAGCVFFEMLSLKPLFPGNNEMDQVARIHGVLGTPDSIVLQKFKHNIGLYVRHKVVHRTTVSMEICVHSVKRAGIRFVRSRMMHFDFVPQKGRGLGQLIPRCSDPSLALLYQMLAYDPDIRISARTALQHICFTEQRMAEKRELQRTIGGVETQASTTPASVEQLWRIARQGRRQQQLKHVVDPFSRRMVPRYPVELPKLNVAIPSPKVPYSVSGLHTLALPHRVLLPAISSKKCHSHFTKPREEPHRSNLKSYYIPPLERKGGGY